MISLLFLILLASFRVLSSISVEYIIGLSFIGIILEGLFIWYPLLEKDKWYKKMSYFKYLHNLLF
jgi:hypothetical protein